MWYLRRESVCLWTEAVSLKLPLYPRWCAFVASAISFVVQQFSFDVLLKNPAFLPKTIKCFFRGSLFFTSGRASAGRHLLSGCLLHLFSFSATLVHLKKERRHHLYRCPPLLVDCDFIISSLLLQVVKVSRLSWSKPRQACLPLGLFCVPYCCSCQPGTRSVQM